MSLQPTVVVRIGQQPYEVYIGRPRLGSPEWLRGQHYGNPYSHLVTSLARIRTPSREAAIRYFEEWLDGTRDPDLEPLRRRWILRTLPRLRGKRLGCFCKPRT